MAPPQAPQSFLDRGITYLINRFGHTIGHKITVSLMKRPFVQNLIRSNPELAKIATEGLVGLTSFFELGGNSPLARLFNNISEVIASESVEFLEEMKEAGAEEAIEKHIEGKVGEVLANKVWVALANIHRKETCMSLQEYRLHATPPERKGKDDKVIKEPSRAQVIETTLEDALAAGKVLCGLCYPAASAPKAEEKKPERKGKAFANLLKELSEKEPELFYKNFIDKHGNYAVQTAKDPALEKKFYAAFHYNLGLEELIFLLRQPHDRWRLVLDGYIGESTIDEKTLEREKREFKEMLENASKELKKIPSWADSVIGDIDAYMEKRREGVPARNGKPAVIGWSEEARRRKRKAHVFSFVMAACLLGGMLYAALQS